jgi:hypothetical protein
MTFQPREVRMATAIPHRFAQRWMNSARPVFIREAFFDGGNVIAM